MNNEFKINIKWDTRLARCNKGPLMTIYIIVIDRDSDIDFFNLKYEDMTDRLRIAKSIGLETRTLTKHLRDEYHCLTSEFPRYYGFLDLYHCLEAIEYLKSLLIANEMRRY